MLIPVARGCGQLALGMHCGWTRIAWRGVVWFGAIELGKSYCPLVADWPLDHVSRSQPVSPKVLGSKKQWTEACVHCLCLPIAFQVPRALGARQGSQPLDEELMDS